MTPFLRSVITTATIIFPTEFCSHLHRARMIALQGGSGGQSNTRAVADDANTPIDRETPLPHADSRDSFAVANAQTSLISSAISDGNP